MSSINQLCEASEFSTSMQFPVYDQNNGQPRKLSGQALVEGVQAAIDSDASGPFKLASYSVAELPSASANAQAIIWCDNGASGLPCLAVSNGVSWLRVTLGAAVSAT